MTDQCQQRECREGCWKVPCDFCVWVNPDERCAAGCQAYANDEDMCPNCVTPWNCNGPHLTQSDLEANHD